MNHYQPTVPIQASGPFEAMKKVLRSSPRLSTLPNGVPPKINEVVRNDAQIKQNVTDELRSERSITASPIGVEVNEGVVTLTGHVDGQGERWLIETAAGRIAGVKRLAVKLEIMPTEPSMRTDDDIAQDCEKALGVRIPGPNEAVKVMVRNGWVALSGEVDWGHQRWAAEATVSDLRGVIGVNSQIAVRRLVTGQSVNTNIEAALYRRAERHFHEIDVVLDRDQVTLNGKVHSWSERRAAINAAWSTAGVSKVTDHTVLVYELSKNSP